MFQPSWVPKAIDSNFTTSWQKKQISVCSIYNTYVNRRLIRKAEKYFWLVYRMIWFKKDLFQAPIFLNFDKHSASINVLQQVKLFPLLSSAILTVLFFYLFEHLYIWTTSKTKRRLLSSQRKLNGVMIY